MRRTIRASRSARPDSRGSTVPAAIQPFTGFRPEAIQFLADLADNNERDLVPAAQGRLRAPAEGAARGAVRRARDAFEARRDPAHAPIRPARRSASTATSASPRTSRRTRPTSAASLPVDRGPAEARHGQARRLLPPGAGRGLRRRWHVAPGVGTQAGRLARPGRSRPGRAARRSTSPRSVDDVRAGLRRRPEARARRATRRTTREADLLKLKDVTFGRRLSDADALSPDLPGPSSPTRLASRRCRFRLLGAPASPGIRGRASSVEPGPARRAAHEVALQAAGDTAQPTRNRGSAGRDGTIRPTRTDPHAVSLPPRRHPEDPSR